jgi:hypothetical protein
MNNKEAVEFFKEWGRDDARQNEEVEKAFAIAITAIEKMDNVRVVTKADIKNWLKTEYKGYENWTNIIDAFAKWTKIYREEEALHRWTRINSPVETNGIEMIETTVGNYTKTKMIEMGYDMSFWHPFEEWGL